MRPRSGLQRVMEFCDKKKERFCKVLFLVYLFLFKIYKMSSKKLRSFHIWHGVSSIKLQWTDSVGYCEKVCIENQWGGRKIRIF